MSLPEEFTIPGEFTLPEELAFPVDPSFMDRPLSVTSSSVESVFEIFPANIPDARTLYLEQWMQIQAQQRRELFPSPVPSLSRSLDSSESSSDEESADNITIDTSPPVVQSPQPSRTATPVEDGDDSGEEDPIARDQALLEFRVYLDALLDAERQDLRRLMAEGGYEPPRSLPDPVDPETPPVELPTRKRLCLCPSPSRLPHYNPVTQDSDGVAAELAELENYDTSGVRAVHAQGRSSMWPGSTHLDKQMLRMRLMLLMGAKARAPA